MALCHPHMFIFSVSALPLITETPAHMGNFSRSLPKNVIRDLLVFLFKRILIGKLHSHLLISVAGYQPIMDPALAINIMDYH